MIGRTCLAAALIAAGCGGKGAPPTATPAPAPAPAASATLAPTAPAASATPPPADELPPPPRAVEASTLAGDFACGPFRTKDFDQAEQPLLNDRVRLHFLPKGAAVGGDESGKIEVKNGDARVFVGARETFLRGDAEFERRAAKVATFGGGYEPLAIAGKGANLTVIAGVLREPAGDGDMVALAHGWFLDQNRDAVDVAVFASRGAIADLAACRLFAQKVLSTVRRGPRTLTYGSNATADTKVSYATFRYRLPPDWALAGSMGIHDFARLRFRKRGVFPAGVVDLQLALDSHPGDWGSPGAEEGRRAGRLLGLPVSWHLTRDPAPPGSSGAWTISTEVVNRDHAVASVQADTPADRDEAVRFAESIVVVR